VSALASPLPISFTSFRLFPSGLRFSHILLSPAFFTILISHPQAELKSFLQFHRTGEEPLRDDEISILNGVLELNTKNVEQIMTPTKVRFVSLL
jgi:CBS domain containing-hemolysin-like protein